jgi:hypothetical protein
MQNTEPEAMQKLATKNQHLQALAGDRVVAHFDELGDGPVAGTEPPAARDPTCNFKRKRFPSPSSRQEGQSSHRQTGDVTPDLTYDSLPIVSSPACLLPPWGPPKWRPHECESEADRTAIWNGSPGGE